MRKHITILCITAAALAISGGVATSASAAMAQAAPAAPQQDPLSLLGGLPLVGGLVGK
jgi:hypothetical protein